MATRLLTNSLQMRTKSSHDQTLEGGNVSGLSAVANLEAFVVIVTYGRSGSTVIQSLLDSIDGWCIRGENDNALGPLAMAWRNVSHSSNLSRLRDAGTSSADDPWAGAELIDASAFGAGLAESFLCNVLRPRNHTRVAGFKEIRWPLAHEGFATVLDFIFEFFPNSRFVFNTRDHEQVSRSAWWARMKPEDVFERLGQYESAISDYMGKHPDRGIRIHYDDYTKDPDTLRPMFDFLGEPHDGGLVDRVMSKPLRHLK